MHKVCKACAGTVKKITAHKVRAQGPRTRCIQGQGKSEGAQGPQTLPGDQNAQGAHKVPIKEANS